MSLAEVFAPAEAQYKAQVMHATWGHLRATPRVKHRAHLIFTEGAYGDYTVIRADIDGVCDSPWLYRQIHEFVARKAKQCKVSVFDGVYYALKNGDGRFIGKTRVLRLPKRTRK